MAVDSVFTDDSGLPEPAGVRSKPWLTGALMGLCGYLWEQAEAHEVFCAATGSRRLSPAKSVIEHLVDQATGAGDDYARDFIAWVIREHWGEEPPAESPREHSEPQASAGKDSA